MAIKGKKSRSKAKTPARAPRREPVQLPTPFFQRRLVQSVLTFSAGLLIFWFGIWLTNGLRADQRHKQAASAATVKTEQASKQRVAVQSWKGTVEAAIGNIGSAPASAGNPTIFTDLSTATASLAKGTAPAGLADTLTQAQTNAKAAQKALNAVDIPGNIVRGKGFDVATTNSLLWSKSQMVLGLDLYTQSVALAQQAADATGDPRKTLGAAAVTLQASASATFNDGWSQLQEALGAVGIFPAPPQGVPGPSGGLGGLPGA